jgi:hypothetical protein
LKAGWDRTGGGIRLPHFSFLDPHHYSEQRVIAAGRELFTAAALLPFFWRRKGVGSYEDNDAVGSD